MEKYNFIKSKLTTRTIVKVISILALISLILFVVPVNMAMYYFGQVEMEMDIEHELNLHEIILKDYSNLQESINSDLRILREDVLLGNYLKDASAQNKQALTERFNQFMEDKSYYEQMRYLDKRGMEVIRINRNGSSVTSVQDDQLQDKSNRNYFTDTMALDPLELYISDLDLNMEQGRIEVPFRPMLRLGTKVLDEGGATRGILVLNYNAAILTRGFIQLNEDAIISTHYIIDFDGNYLFHNDTSLEWSKQKGPEGLFDLHHPGVLDQMKNDKDILRTDSDVFIYSTMSHYTWMEKPDVYFITQLDGAEYSTFSTIHITAMLTLWLLMTLLLFFIYNQRRLKQHIQNVNNIIYYGLEHNPVVAILTDDNGNIVYVNEAFEKVTGYSFQEVYGKNPNVLKSGDMSSDNYKEMWDTILEGKSWNGEFHNKRKDGTYYWAEARISAIFDKKGRIQHFLSLQNNVTDKKAAISKYHELALKDPLTGAFNRNIYILEENKDLLASTLIKNSSMVYMLDIDHFKKVNDTYGHNVGDEILEYIVDFLKQHVRSDDLVIRYGGEEFLLILSIMNEENGIEFGERIRHHFEETSITTTSGDINIHVSIGMTRVQRDNEDMNEVIKRVDKALYEAKNTGRNKLVFKQK